MATVAPRLKKRRLSPDMALNAPRSPRDAPYFHCAPVSVDAPAASTSAAGPAQIAPGAPEYTTDAPAWAVGVQDAPRDRASVREVINGCEQQVYLVSDDDDDAPPPASPLRAPPTPAMPPSAKRKSALDEAAPPTPKRARHQAYAAAAAPTPLTPLAAVPTTPLAPLAPYPADAAYADAWPPYAPPSATLVPPVPPVEPVVLDDKDGHIIVREGDYITSRYRIRRLLGQGTFGKVVQCYDRQLNREVAIKVIRAVQKYRDASQIEIRVLRRLRQHDPENRYQCVQLLETFEFRQHVCIVSDLLDRSVFDFLKDNKFQPFPCADIWSFAHQLMKSVAFLHRLSLIHTDLKPENVLLVDASFDLIASSSRRAAGRRKRVLRRSDIRLIDFGSATFSDEYHSGVVSTRHYRAPEIILGMGWSFPCDAWSLGCILIEFYTGEALFQTHDNLEHLAMMEAVLGPLPDDYRRKAETYKPEYFRHGRLDYPRPDTTKQSKRYVQSMKRLADMVAGPPAYEKHARMFVSLLKALLEYDPAKRITVQQALEHPYFQLQPHELPA